MIVHSVLFGDNSNYERMARVLAHTIGVNSPSTPLVLHRVTEPDEDLIAAIEKRPHNRRDVYLDNARKTKHWNKIVQEAPEGEVLCLMDADMMVLNDLRCIERYVCGCGIGITSRPGGSVYPVNTGVVFVHVAEPARMIFAEWLAIVVEMLADLPLHMRWKADWGGINQAAYGCLIDRLPIVGKLRLDVRCESFNCETECQLRGLFDEHTKAVHIIGNLRRHLFNAESAKNGTIEKLAGIWHEYERQAMGAAA